MFTKEFMERVLVLVTIVCHIKVAIEDITTLEAGKIIEQNSTKAHEFNL